MKMIRNSVAPKPAFTLAEVLITLGIIGIIAALTLPAVINNTQKKERREALKKAYSVLQQALLMYQKDTGEDITLTTFNTETEALKKAILPYFNGAVDCGKGTENTACLYNRSETNKYKNYNNTNEAQKAYLDDGQYVAIDGMMYFFENEASSSEGATGRIFIFVDVNGFNRNPNQLGRDLFAFELVEKGKILPVGANETHYDENIYCSKTSTNSANGIACTNRALYDNNFWKD